MAKPFRFGVQLPKEPSASAWRDTARKIEDLGYATLFMPDHFGDELAPMPAIAMAAAHTTTLRIGSLVFDNDYKHPAILAKEAATIDLATRSPSTSTTSSPPADPTVSAASRENEPVNTPSRWNSTRCESSSRS